MHEMEHAKKTRGLFHHKSDTKLFLQMKYGSVLCHARIAIVP